jgi:hypothetical protein
MRAHVPLIALTILFAAGCDSDTGFSNNPDDVQTVEGTGSVGEVPTELVWTELKPGVLGGRSFVVENVGEQNLVIYMARLTNSANGVFYLPETRDKTIGPGGTYQIDITAELPGDKEKHGALEVKTNDVDNLTFTLDLHAYPEGWEPEDTGGGGDSADSGDDSGEDSGEDSGGDDSGR